MKKWMKVAIIIIICVILLVPIPVGKKGGGTVEYRAVLYSVKKYDNTQLQGHVVGTQVRVLFWTVYDDVKYVPVFGELFS